MVRSSSEPPFDKTKKIGVRPPKTLDQPRHPPSLTRVFPVLSIVVEDPSFLHANTQADLSLCWVHMPFCWFCHEVAQVSEYLG